jgi:hypothetical protein
MTDDIRRRLDNHEHRIVRLEQSQRDIEGERRKVLDEQRHEFAQMMAGAQRMVERTLATALSPIAPKLERLESLYVMNEEQMQLLKEASIERQERRLRDRIALEQQTESERKKADLDAETAKKLVEMKEKREHFIKVCAAVATLITAIAGFVGAVLAARH